MADYSAAHWQKRIPQYFSETWSASATPFAKLAGSYFPKDGRILELGAGAGQDGLWFAAQGWETVISDASAIGLPEIEKRARDRGLENVSVILLDITEPLHLADASFDVVYAQLVLHYFDDARLRAIIAEIRRVLKTDGILACMVNSTKDPEYDETRVDTRGLLQIGDLRKRYFTADSFRPFVKDFEALLFDEKGRTPKDDSVKTSGMVQFIGKKR